MSPFKSKSQQKFMFSKHPKIAKRWASKYGVDKDLPEKVSAKEMLKQRGNHSK
jgi:hypothetical protein